MSEYPWDMENMMLAQHDQPCDCAICDEIHFNRETRRRHRLREKNALAQCLSDIEGYKMRVENLNEELLAAKAKCNLYKCMDRKDLKLRIEQLEKQHKQVALDCIEIIKKYDDERDAEATLCGYVLASSVKQAIAREFGLEI